MLKEKADHGPVTPRQLGVAGSHAEVNVSFRPFQLPSIQRVAL
jgi:hypothetical protein